MTLVIAWVNADAAVVVADSRTSDDKGPFDDAVVKVIEADFSDGRVAISFTGPASAVWPGHKGPPPLGGFRTISLITDGLMASVDDERRMLPTINRFAGWLSDRWPQKRVERHDSILAVGFAGFRYDEAGVHPVIGAIQNYEPHDATKVRLVDRFSVSLKEPPGMMALGQKQAIVENTRIELAELIGAGKPVAGTVEKAVEVIREAAASPAANGTVGNLCVSLIVPKDPREPTISKHHADKVGETLHAPHRVNLTSGVIVTDVSIRGGLPGEPPVQMLAIPKVRRNEPCPCGSGQKYKRCHGR